MQITVAETVGVETRAGYYDHAGALRDMLQNHMLQVLALVAMEPPPAMEADALRDEKVKVLRKPPRGLRAARPGRRCAPGYTAATSTAAPARAISTSRASLREHHRDVRSGRVR